jgi:hypothetical protein
LAFGVRPTNWVAWGVEYQLTKEDYRQIVEYRGNNPGSDVFEIFADPKE